MAYEIPGQIIPLASSGNQNGNQFRLMKCGTAAGSATLVTAVGDNVLGVLQNTPTTGGGDAASIMVSGITKVYKNTTSAAVAFGDQLVPTTAGGVTTSTSKAVTNYVVGLAMEAMSSGTTGLLSMFINHNGRGSSGD